MEPNKITPLSAIEAILNEEDFETQLAPVTETQPFEQLKVSLGKDSKDRLLELHMHFVNDVTGALGGVDDVEDIYLLQCFLLLPFQAQPERQADMAHLLLSLNRLLPIGAFGMSYPDGSIYIQYNATSEDREINEAVLLEVVGMLSFFCMEFGGKIEEVAEGTLSSAVYLHGLKEAGIQLPPLRP